jgi:hypothetical protein
MHVLECTQFTGCDSVSAFAGKGKVSEAVRIEAVSCGLKLLENPSFQNVFAQLGKEWKLTDDLAERLQEFTCRLYATRSTVKTVNDLRYQLFREKKCEVESDSFHHARTACIYMQRGPTTKLVFGNAVYKLPQIPHILVVMDGLKTLSEICPSNG